MSLTEALKTKRKFRRLPDKDTWFKVVEGRVVCERNGTLLVANYSFNVEELTSDKWEPEPLVLELSAQDLYDAAKAIVMTNPQANNRRLSMVESARLLADQLGLTA